MAFSMAAAKAACIRINWSRDQYSAASASIGNSRLVRRPVARDGANPNHDLARATVAKLVRLAMASARSGISGLRATTSKARSRAGVARASLSLSIEAHPPRGNLGIGEGRQGYARHVQIK